MARSRFAGMYNAVDFAYGCAGSAAGPLSIAQGNSAAGVSAVILNFSYTDLLDGTILSPVATNTPINFGIGANQELLTPSAVGSSTLLGGINQSVTANFANVHGIGDVLSSGTFGLQEAINYAYAKGGGSVIVDGRWTLMGGTTAMIAAAALQTGVTILDLRSGQAATYTKQVAITNAQTLLLNTNGVELIPAPGTGILIDVQDMVVEAIFAVAAFTGGSAISANYDTGTSAPATATIATTFLTSFSATQVIKVAGTLAVLAKTACVGKSLRLTAASTEFANASSGVSTLLVTVNYRLISGL